MLGTDGVQKMSKSLGNTIDILAAPEVIRKQIMSMVTDTKRILRTDPGRPEVCNVCQLQPAFGDDYETLWEGERTARTGCVDMKKLLADRIIAHYAEARERYLELMADPARVDGDPGRRRRAHPAHRRGDDGRGPARRWACAERHMTASPFPGPRDRRLLSTLLILGVIAVFFTSSASSPAVLLLRRHLPDVLPGLAAGVHHQPDRQPHRRRHPAPAAGGRDDPRLHRGRAGPRRPRGRGRGRAGDLDHPVRRVDPGHQDEPADDPRAVAGSGSTRSGSARSTSSPRRRLRWPTSTTSPPRSSSRCRQIAVASLSVVGTMLIVFFLSIYMVVDRDDILAFLFRIVPPSYSEEARLLETSVSRSFGGFLRGQALMGAVYFLVALATNLLLGLPLAALTSVLAGLLQMIPFFGPFVSWAPPVIVALVLQPESALPGAHPDGRRLARGDERPPAADHAGRGRHPPDRRPRLGPDRRPDRRHPGRDLRDPDRRRRLGLPPRVPAPDLGRPDRSPAGRRAASRSATGDRSASRASRRPAARPTSTSWSSTSPTSSSPTTQPKRRPRRAGVAQHHTP